MADTKISALTALTGANTASDDLLVIVDTSATETKKITLTELQSAPVSAGTANGILYLNGSKVASSGSALTFDGTNLSLLPTGYSVFGASSAEAMRLTSTGLGIGTTAPPLKLSILSGVTTSDASTPVVMLGSDRTDRYASINSLRGSASSFIGLTLSTSNNAAPAEVAWLMPNGDLIHKVNSDVNSLTTNSTMMFRLASDTSLQILVRGSDGTTRSASLTLA